jgi:regulator of sirC expression with transglutaminase-like and TPR domain
LGVENLQSLIKDWKMSVVSSAVLSNNSDRLAEYALHMSRILAYPDLDVNSAVEDIDVMGEEFRLLIKNLMPLRPTQMIEQINNFLFKDKQFKANVQDYYNPLNSYLNVVLQHRCGIPITLSILYMRIAFSVNFKLHPVNFPAHFLIKYILDDNDVEIIIDPFYGGRIMDDYSLKALLDQFYPHQNVALTRAIVEKATVGQVLIRMLNNLKASYYESQDLDKAEIANEMIISIDQHNPDAMRDKGLILLRRGNSIDAVKMLNLYLELDPEAEDADEILDIIRNNRTLK